MLSRIAESLFWIGRYVERADDTARILDVHLQMLLEDPWIDEAEACRSLLSVMGVGRDPDEEGATLGRAIVLERLAFDLAEPELDRRGARRGPGERPPGAGDRLLGDVGVPQHHLDGDRAGPAPGDHVPPLLPLGARARRARGRDRRRDDEPRRRLALPGAGPQPGAGRHDRPAGRHQHDRRRGTNLVDTLLRSCGAHESYLRTYRGVASDERAAEFLLLDRLFPRSVLYALQQAEECLEVLAPAPERVGVSDRRPARLGRARTSLEYRPLEEVLSDLPAEMEKVQQACSAASDAVARRYFPRPATTSWRGEEVS